MAVLADTGSQVPARGAGGGPRIPALLAARRPLLAAIAVWAVVAILITVIAWYARTVLPYMGDLWVYRSAGTHVLAGRAVYPPVPRWQLPLLGKTVLVFTYPPVSALLAVPLALLSWHATEFAWIPVVYVPLGVVVWLAFRPLLARAGRWAAAVFGAVLAGSICLTPMVQDMRYGQVDILLAAMCVADLVVRRPRWPRGVAIGLAAAIKLTPAIFIVYLLITGRRKAAAVATGTAAAATALSWLLIPRDFAAFWTGAVLQPDRLGPNVAPSNQSIRAILLRLFAPGVPPAALWLALALAAGAAGLAAARAARNRGDEIGGVAITGLVAVLVSPVSWIHHMVWVIPAMGVIVGDGRNRHRWQVAVGTAILFLPSLPNRAWDPLFQRYAPATLLAAIQDSFGIAAALLIVIMAALPPPVHEAPEALGVPAQRVPDGAGGVAAGRKSAAVPADRAAAATGMAADRAPAATGMAADRAAAATGIAADRAAAVPPAAADPTSAAPGPG